MNQTNCSLFGPQTPRTRADLTVADQLNACRCLKEGGAGGTPRSGSALFEKGHGAGALLQRPFFYGKT